MEERKSVLQALQAYQLRELIDMANQRGIKKENIVTVLPDATNGFYLLYFN